MATPTLPRAPSQSTDSSSCSRSVISPPWRASIASRSRSTSSTSSSSASGTSSGVIGWARARPARPRPARARASTSRAGHLMPRWVALDSPSRRAAHEVPMTTIETTEMRRTPASDVSADPRPRSPRCAPASSAARRARSRGGARSSPALGQLVSQGADELLHALQQDLRKPVLEAWGADVGYVKQDVKLAQKNLAKWTPAGARRDADPPAPREIADRARAARRRADHRAVELPRSAAARPAGGRDRGRQLRRAQALGDHRPHLGACSRSSCGATSIPSASRSSRAASRRRRRSSPSASTTSSTRETEPSRAR